jgi:4-amino-4-deoxy-L-arabinose transferase-like glycosyltransferase
MKKKIISWFKDKENLPIIALIVFSIIIRLYYFFLTKNQPLWWDEAEYLNMAKHWAFGLSYQFLPERPLLFSLILAPILKLFNNEIIPRLIISLFSLFSVIGIYYLGKEIYNKRIGLISGFLMAVFSFGLFFSQRLLVDIPSLTFFIFSAYFFYLYFKNENPKFIYMASLIIGIGTLIRIQTALILFIVFFYFLITKRSFIRKKEVWLSALIFILILSPYIIWGYFQFHSFVITDAGKLNAAKNNFFLTGLTVLKNYLVLFPNYIFSINILIPPIIFGFVLVAILIIYSYDLLLCFDILYKGENLQLNKKLFVLLLLFIPLIFTSFSIAHNEDRYILTSIPGTFIILSYFGDMIYNRIIKKQKFWGFIFLLTLFLTVGYFQLNQADFLIKSKIDSYSQVRDAGIYLKKIASKSDIVVSNSKLQIAYYSDLKVLNLPSTKEEFELDILNEKPKYLSLSGFEVIPDWINAYIKDKNMSVVNVYFIDYAKTQPAVIIYAFNKNETFNNNPGIQ